MLSLGIAANSAVFSLVNGLFLRPFAFPDQDRLVFINETAPKWNLDVVGINYPDFHLWRQEAKLFEGMALWQGQSFNLSTPTANERIDGARVTHDLGKVLGIEPLLGRDFLPEEDRPGGAPVVLITERVWRDRFGRRNDVLGQTLKLDGVVRTIVGVLPPEADFAGDAEVWVPLQGDPNQEGHTYTYDGVGRLKPGVTVEEAEKDLLRAHEPIWQEDDKERIVSPFARPLREELVRDFASAAKALSAAVALLLVVACANVASVMLARSVARRREMSLRLALGAGARRILRQLLVENVLLALAGAAIGLALGQWALQYLLTMVPEQLPHFASFEMDLRLIAFVIVASMSTLLLFGWAPMLAASRGDMREAVGSARGATVSPRAKRTLRILVAGEAALATLLLVAAGLLIRAFDRVGQVDPGFRADGVLTFALSLPAVSYPEEDDRLAFWDRVSSRMSAIPGVDAAGLVSCAPLGCHWGNFFEFEGVEQKPDDSIPVTLMRFASADYFRTMGIRLKSGRFFDDREGREPLPAGAAERTPRVAVVNETFARTFWPNVSDAVGRRFRYNGDENSWITVIGVVHDIKHYGLEKPMRPGVYFPLPSLPLQTLTVALHTEGDPSALAPPVRAAIEELDPELPLYQLGTMEDKLRRSLMVRAAYSWMLGVFALLALVLALGGAYGVASYLVTQRTREIGIRMAFGASTRHIVGSVVRGGLAVATAGIALGLALSLGAGRLLSDLLFGASQGDPAVLGGVASVLVMTAFVANWLPARRAARVDPMRSLRTE
jgi:predicted permease